MMEDNYERRGEEYYLNKFGIKIGDWIKLTTSDRKIYKINDLYSDALRDHALTDYYLLRDGTPIKVGSDTQHIFITTDTVVKIESPFE